ECCKEQSHLPDRRERAKLLWTTLRRKHHKGSRNHSSKVTKQHRSRKVFLSALTVVTLLVLAASIRYGAIDFSITEIGRALASLLPGRPEPNLDQRILLELRFPRAVLCLLVGA